jgi:hypothetical protein
MYKIKQLFYSIKNLIEWFPIIWDDRQWDQEWLYRLWKKKFELMEKFYRSDKCMCVDCGETANQIHRLVELLDRLLEHPYFDEAYKKFNDTYPSYDWSMTHSFIDSIDHPGYTEFVSNDTPEQAALSHQCMIDENELEEKDLGELFSSLNKEIRGFWD